MMAIRIPSTRLSAENFNGTEPFSLWSGVFDPQSKFINRCNYFLLFIGIYGLYVDCLIFFLPMLDNSGFITVDLHLCVSVSFLQAIGDVFLLMGMILRFRTAFEERALNAPFGKRKLVNDRRIIAVKYLKSTFTIDLLASLPLPQVYLWYCVLASTASQPTHVFNNLLLIVGAQFHSRLLVTYILYRKIEKSAGVVIRSPWSGCLYILLLYGMLSHFLGAIYYHLYTDELLDCRKMVFQKEANATTQELDQLVAQCTEKKESEGGLLSEAFENNVGSRSFSQKYMFCFSWGLKTISSMGQNLNSSVSIVDTSFNLLVVMVGLLLFADLIARMQTCMQSAGEREEQHMVRERELEEWTTFHQLPPYLKKRVGQTVQYQLHATRCVDDEAILDSLPTDLRCEIRRHLYLGLVHELPIFEEMDDQFLHAICGYLRTFTGTEGMFIVLEGDPIQKLLFIVSGQLEIFSINGGSSSCTTVGPGGFCGQELLPWSSLSSTSMHNLPSSTHTVRCLTDVEAFSLLAKDLKLLAIQFNYDLKLYDVLSRESS